MTDFPIAADQGDHLDLLLATSEIGVWELDVETGRAIRNLRHDQIFGHEVQLEDWSADTFLTYVLEHDRDRVGRLLEESVSEGKRWSFETRIKRADGVDRWISAKGVPKFDHAGRIKSLIGHVIDITNTKQTEERLDLLTRELNHRVSNTFTILNSMIRHVRTNATTVDEFADTLLDRLAALSRSNKVLVAGESERSSLSDILEMELDAFAAWRSRVEINGGTGVWLTPEASEALSLIFHELLTNALKHGALSVEGGTVTVDVSNAGESGIAIRWVERDGPGIAAERGSGIGTSVLNNAMRDQGRVTLDFAPGGLVCEILVHESLRKSVPEQSSAAAVPTPAPARAANGHALFGRKILVVEDDPIIGLDIAGILDARGAKVIGPLMSTESALEALSERPDAALLDINLGRETSEDVAERLSELGVPHIVLSGQVDSGDLGPAFAGTPVIAKPFDERQLVDALAALLAR